MSLTALQVKKIADLARLNMSEADLDFYARQLTHIFQFIEHMNEIDTTGVQPLAHPSDLNQRLRPDEITEANQRELLQSIAPAVQAGLYIVPKVIDDE